MKILLFGGSGQLGHEIIRRGRDLNFSVISPVSSEVDVSDRQQVLFLAKNVRPDVIVNSAAYTQVDKAEEEKDAAFRVNCEGARCVAEAAKSINAKLIHISTDYVFGGEEHRLYKEDDDTNPLCVYGHSKLAGEKEILREYPEKSAILRTASLHGRYGANFVHTMLRLFDGGELVKVVDDQFMSPTWAGFLAEVTLDFCRSAEVGIFHASNTANTSWYSFAKAVFELSAATRSPDSKAELAPAKFDTLKRPAKRPRYSPFSTEKLAKALGRPVPTWEEGLVSHLQDIGRIKH